MLFGKRRSLGVEEGNAIDTIIVHEWQLEQGRIPTKEERDAYAEAWQVVERRSATKHPVAQVWPQYEDNDSGYMFDEDEQEGVVPVHDTFLTIIAGFVLFVLTWLLIATMYNTMASVAAAHP